MKNSLRILLLACVFSFMGTDIHADVHGHATVVDAVDGADFIINGDYLYSLVRSDDQDQFIITKMHNDGSLDSGFGDNGVVTITLGATGSMDDDYIAIPGYQRLVPESTVKMSNGTHSNRTYITFQVEVAGGNKNICVVQFVRSTGVIRLGFNGTGLRMITVTDNFTLNDVAMEGSKLIVAGHLVTGMVNTARIYRLLGLDGSLDSTFNTGSPMDFSSVLTDAEPGITVVRGRDVDGSGVAFYVGGSRNIMGTREAFVVRCNSDGTVNSAFNSNAGIYSTTGSALGVSGTVHLESDIPFNRLTLTWLNTTASMVRRNSLYWTGGLAANQNYQLLLNSTLKQVIKPSTNRIYFSGTVDFGGEYIPYVARFVHSSGAPDTVFVSAMDDLGLANGIFKIDPTVDDNVAVDGGVWMAYHLGQDVFAAGIVKSVEGEVVFGQMFGPLEDYVVEQPELEEQFEEPDDIAPETEALALTEAPSGRARRDRSFAQIAVSGTNLNNINDGGVMVTSYDDVVSFFRSGNTFIFTQMNEQGQLETNFGQNGVSKIRLRLQGAGPQVGVVPHFKGMADNSSYMTFDPETNNIVLATQVQVRFGRQRIAIMRLDGETGELDPTFGSGGVVLTNTTSSSIRLESVSVDEESRVVVGVHRNVGAGIQTADIYRFVADGSFDPAFNSGQLVNLRPVADSLQEGFTTAVDVDGNIYIGGQESKDTGGYELLLTKLNGFDGSLDESFAGTGTYRSGRLQALNGGQYTGAFLSVYQFDDVENIQLIAQRRDAGAGIVIEQLDFDGNEDEQFGVDGRRGIPFDGLIRLNHAERNEDGNLFIGGTIDDDSETKTLVGRITPTGQLDSNFGDEYRGSKLGYALLEPSQHWETTDGGFFFIDSGSSIPVAWLEENGPNRRLIVKRLIGTDDYDINVPELVEGADLATFSQANHINDANRLYAYLHVDKRAESLQAEWESVGGVLDAVTIATGITLFKEALQIMIDHVVERYAVNAAASALGVKAKQGSMRKQMRRLMRRVDNAFTQAQMDAMDAGVNRHLDEVYDELGLGRQNITGQKRKTRKRRSE